VRASPSAAAHASPMPFNPLPATPSAHMSARGANAGCHSVSRPLPRRRQREPAHRGMTRRRPRPPCLRAACLTAATRPRPPRAAPHLQERLMLVTACGGMCVRGMCRVCILLPQCLVLRLCGPVFCTGHRQLCGPVPSWNSIHGLFWELHNLLSYGRTAMHLLKFCSC
jgi:hypothetical protein